MGTIGVNVLTNPAGATTVSLTHGSVTFTATSPFITGSGYYADGVPYIVAPIGNVSFDSITPAESTTPLGLVISGASKNLVVEDAAQGWDERFSGYNAANTFDVASDTVTAGDIITKVVSRSTSTESFTASETRDGMGEFAACHIVASAPADNTISPAPIGWTGRGTPAGHALTDTLDNIISALRGTYTSSGQDTVSSSAAFALINKYSAPGLALAKGGVTGFEYRVLAPYLYGSSGGVYGRDIAEAYNYLVLGILTDAWSAADAKTALIHLIQTGASIYDTAAGAGNGYPVTGVKGNGGHYQYALTPVLWYLKYTGQTAAITTTLRDVIPTNELWQSSTVSATAATYVYTEHDSASFSQVSRSRQITNKVGNVITLEEHAPDTTYTNVAGHYMCLSATPATRTLVTEGSFTKSGDREITVSDASGFSIGNDVYFTPSWAIQEGDHEWWINTPTDATFQGTYNSDEYQALQRWYGSLVTVRALGLYNASVFGSFEQLSLRNLRANQPSATYDRNVAGTGYGADGWLHSTSWTRAFHADHAATIFPDWSDAAPTLSSSSPADNATGVAVGANITLTFSESVRFGYGTITLRENNGGWADLEVFDFANPAVWGTGAGQISISGSTLTINPTADLTASREYAIQVGSGAITNLKYVPFAGIADDTTLSFTTA